MVAAGSITVAVRVRPPTAWEFARLPEPCYDTTIRGDGALSTPGRVSTASSLRDIVQIVDDRIITFDPDEKDRARAFVERGFLPPGTKRYKDRRFMFDRVFGHEARQQDVYESTAQPLLKGLLDGFNATVFAYGATGCGKTHTISGTEDDPGIIYLTMADLFQRIEDRRDEWNVEVMVTFLEIYNEEIRDLLAEPGSVTSRGGLSIREDKSVKVVGLVEAKPCSAEEVKQIVLLGNERRTQSPTHANATSSRSHAVLQVHITQSPRTASLTEERTMATLSIIDLAGSERAAATTNMGQRMVEGANINKSLLALGNCINALCESGGAVRHIPYRNSKLTRLLKFSLGGNCKTVMIVCVAPTSNHFDDTHNTLIYAERATKIKTRVVTRNVVNVDRHVGRYVEAINRLNSEIAELKAKIAGKKDTENEIARRKKAEAIAEAERAKNDMQVKVEQTKPSIMDGATCTGKITVAKTRLAAIRARLAQIDAQAASSGLTGDLEAEKALLQALAGPEEQAIKPDSALTIRLNRSSNSNAMFDATLRAVSERKSEKLDEVNVDNVKLDARCKRAEMERLKAEGERDALRDAVKDMAEVLVKLVGMLGRCTVMVGDAAKTLNDPQDDNASPTAQTAKEVGNRLSDLKEQNDASFKNLLGHSTEGYLVADNRATTPAVSSLDIFSSYGSTFQRRISTGAPVAQQIGASKPFSRRSSSYATLSAPTSPPRRGHKSPRKSLRSSISAQPYGRISDKEKRGLKPSKNVQWRDEVGQGDLDDGGPRGEPRLSVTVIPASPEEVGNRLTAGSSASTSAVPSDSGIVALPPGASVGGSESEWEDDEKTDDSITLNFLSGLQNSISSAPSSSSNGASGSRMQGAIGGKRQRPSRLDPSFLKSRAKAPTLGSLTERDENGSPERRGTGYNPLSDVNLNNGMRDDDSGSSEGKGSASGGLRVPASHNRVMGSPGRRGPGTPRGAGVAASSGTGLGKSLNGRRRSTLGASRNDKGRRRSSLIPQLSPSALGGGPRRVMVASPAKRPKRLSLSKGMGSARLKPLPALSSTMAANMSMTSAEPGDMSINRSSRPTWR